MEVNVRKYKVYYTSERPTAPPRAPLLIIHRKVYNNFLIEYIPYVVYK